MSKTMTLKAGSEQEIINILSEAGSLNCEYFIRGDLKIADGFDEEGHQILKPLSGVFCKVIVESEIPVSDEYLVVEPELSNIGWQISGLSDFNELNTEPTDEEVERFKKGREALIANSIVTVSTGKRFDAHKDAITNLANSIIKHIGHNDDYIVKWSTADVGTGVMVDCTKAEIVEAHKLAVEYVEKVWGIE